jgi:hypothetical protein
MDVSISSLRQALSAKIETYISQCDGSRSQTYQAAVAGVGLMHSIGIVVAELFQYVVNTLVVLGDDKLTDDPLKPRMTVVRSCISNVRQPCLHEREGSGGAGWCVEHTLELLSCAYHRACHEGHAEC